MGKAFTEHNVSFNYTPGFMKWVKNLPEETKKNLDKIGKKQGYTFRNVAYQFYYQLMLMLNTNYELKQYKTYKFD